MRRGRQASAGYALLSDEMPQMRAVDGKKVKKRISRLNISIASGKGGTGKTTIAANMAYMLAQSGQSVAYVDCDVEEPNGHLFLKPEISDTTEVSIPIPKVNYEKCNFCGKCAEVCSFNAIAVLADKVMIFPSMCHGCGGCYHLCPEEAIEEIDRPIGVVNKGTGQGVIFIEGRLNVGEAISPPITRAAKQVMPISGISLIDAPPGTSCPVLEAIGGTDYVILVTEPTPFGLNDLKLAVGMVRVLDLPFGVIVNRSDIGDDRVDEYCREEKIDVLLKIPFDRQYAADSSRGDLIMKHHPEYGDKLMQVFKNIKDRFNGNGTGSTER